MAIKGVSIKLPNGEDVLFSFEHAPLVQFGEGEIKLVHEAAPGLMETVLVNFGQVSVVVLESDLEGEDPRVLEMIERAKRGDSSEEE